MSEQCIHNMNPDEICFNCIHSQYQIEKFEPKPNGGVNVTLADGGRICTSIKRNVLGHGTNIITFIPPREK